LNWLFQQVETKWVSKIWYLYWTGYSSKLRPSGFQKSFKIMISAVWYFVNLDILIFLIFDIWYLVANNFKHKCAKKVY
jgi:hypothetical protein